VHTVRFFVSIVFGIILALVKRVLRLILKGGSRLRKTGLEIDPGRSLRGRIRPATRLTDLHFVQVD